LLTLALSLYLVAQPVGPPGGEKGDDVLARARQLYGEQGPKAALPELERALSLYRAAEDGRGEAGVLGLIGNCYKHFGDFPKAVDYLSRALAQKERLGERREEGITLGHLGLVFWEMGEYPKAIEHFDRSIAIGRDLGDRQLEGSSLNNLSLVYDELGDYQRSLEQYNRALELYRGTDFPRGEGDTLGNIGGVHLLLGRYRKAMEYYQQALAISERLALKPAMSQDLGNLALCHLGLGQVDEALRSFDRALALAQEAGLHKEEADWLKGKGMAHARRGLYDRARDEYREAYEAYERAGLKREQVEVLNDLSNLHVALGDATTAETDLRRAIEQARAIGHARGVTFNLLALGDLERRRQRNAQAEASYREALEQARQANDQGHTAASLNRLAAVQRDQGRFEEAAKAGQQALELARANEDRVLEAEARHVLGEVARARGASAEALDHYGAGEEVARTIGDPDLGWRLAYGRGQALEGLGREEEAAAAFEEAVVLIENVRAQLREERFRTGYIEDKYEVYLALVRLLLRRGRIGEAFSFAERLRARSYLDSLPHERPLPGRERSEAVVELRERIWQLERAAEEERMKPPPGPRRAALELFSSELAQAERAYRDLVDDLRSREAQPPAARVATAQEVQQSLPPGGALLDYVVGDDEVTVFVLRADRLLAKTAATGRADLQARVELLRDLILRRESDEWRAPAAGLARLLVEPLEQEGWLEGIERLYLVPHGVLHYLPFAVLPRRTDRGTRFLVEDYVLGYLPAASALSYGPESGGPVSERRLLALGPARARLRYAGQEVRSLARYLPADPLVLVGPPATESSFKEKAGSYRVLHLATHGYLNKRNPLLSGLDLEPDEREDGRLEVHEILDLRLDADLVTLSACNTALGTGYFAEVPAGDDFVGLTRAFLVAGSPSVLASLWEVNDRSTLRLMQRFYGHWRGADKAVALALAQREMLGAAGAYRHPYYWAPFVLAGSMN
jgi:CHAT domain-containing protein/Tfp pilus assembly protein PilF